MLSNMSLSLAKKVLETFEEDGNNNALKVRTSSNVSDLIEVCTFNSMKDLSKIENYLELTSFANNASHNTVLQNSSEKISTSVQSLTKYALTHVRSFVKDILDITELKRSQLVQKTLNHHVAKIKVIKEVKILNDDNLKMIIDHYKNFEVLESDNYNNTELSGLLNTPSGISLMGLVHTGSDDLDRQVEPLLKEVTFNTETFLRSALNGDFSNVENSVLQLLAIHGLFMGRHTLKVENLNNASTRYLKRAARSIAARILEVSAKQERNIEKMRIVESSNYVDGRIGVYEKNYNRWLKQFPSVSPDVLLLIERDPKISTYEAFFDESVVESKVAALKQLQLQATVTANVEFQRYMDSKGYAKELEEELASHYVEETHLESDTAASLQNRFKSVLAECPYNKNIDLTNWAIKVASKTIAPNTDAELVLDQLNHFAKLQENNSAESVNMSKRQAMISVVAKVMAHQFAIK